MNERTARVEGLETVRIELADDVIRAYVPNDSVPVGELAGLIFTTHAALASLA